MNNIGKKAIIEISKQLEIPFKRCCSYVNKKFEGTKTSYNYSFLLADNYLVLYFSTDIAGTHIRDTADLRTIRQEFSDKLMAALPNKILSGESEFTLYPIVSLLASSNEPLMEIVSNSYNIVIPTSIKHGLNILDENPISPMRDLAEYMRTHAVWYYRKEDGPPLVTDEDDCYIKEYIVSVLSYI